MKLSFRLTLLTILLLLIGGAVAAVGVVSYVHASVVTDDLSAKMLHQTEARIDLEIKRVLSQAIHLNDAIKQRARAGRLRVDDFPGLVAYWQDTFDITSDLTGAFIGLEATGECAGVTRLSGKPSIWQSGKSPKQGAYHVREYWLSDYPQRPYSEKLDVPEVDIRRRPWYVQASQAHRSIWTDTFVFMGVEGVRDIQGVTYATPIENDRGALLGVLDADFELQQLCSFFQTLNLGADGLAFVIETRRDGRMQVIAHPRKELLIRTNQRDGQPVKELMSPDDFPDARVAAFAAQRLSTSERTNPSDKSTRFLVDGVPYLGTAYQIAGGSVPPWTVCIILPEAEVLGQVHRSIRITVVVGVCLIVLAILISLYISGQVAKPLEQLATEANAVGQLRFQRGMVAHSVVREVDQLAIAMEDMKVGLRSFQKYVPADLVRSVVSSRQEASFGGEKRKVTIFFSDIANFTTIAETLSPEELVERLREYLDALSKQIVKTGGTVDKYIGDAIMAFWGAPGADPEQAVHACRAALDCQGVLRTLSREWEATGKPVLHTRIGIHTGEVVVGNIGSDTRLNYTVIGDAVNLASRLEGLNKYYGSNVLISESTYHEAESQVIARPIDYVSVKGRVNPILVFELLGWKADADNVIEELSRTYGQALESYRRQNWAEAISLFGRVLTLKPHDPATLLMLERCRVYQANPPGSEWDGAYHSTSK